MITIYQRGPNSYRIFVKGAPEMIVDGCNEYVKKEGKAKLEQTLKNHIMNTVLLSFARQSLRTILMAYRDVETNPCEWSDEKLAEDLTLIGITGIKDPLRPEIIDAVKKCKRAGIMVRMVTGDNYNTAVAIAKECGILEPDFKEGRQGDYTALEGKKFREIVGGIIYEKLPGKDQTVSKVGDIKKFEEVASQLRVLARSTPDDKYLLVTGLIQLQNVVAVTGDGTNDAPALKKADVGFAMGIAGTEVAKEAAGIILLDDNFSSIVTACKWGRNIYDCIRKFIQFQLSISVTALTMAFVGAVSISESPLTPIQILWVNLIMDTFAALALATEPPTEDLLKRKPYSRNEYIVTPTMWRGILAQVVYQIVILCVILFAGPRIFGIPNGAGAAHHAWNPDRAVHFTMFFHTFVLCQLVNEINCRKLKRNEKNVFANACNNPFFWGIELFQVIVQILLVEFGGMFVRCAPLSLYQHLYCIAFAMGGLVVGVIVKLIPESLYSQCVIFKEIEDWDNPEELKTPLKY
jgi:P-type Ca2+ transporter type 2B